MVIRYRTRELEFLGRAILRVVADLLIMYFKWHFLTPLKTPDKCILIIILEKLSAGAKHFPP